MKQKSFFLSLASVAISTFIAGFSLLNPGLPPTHDGEYHIVRFYQFNKTFRDGNWYPRWQPDLNSGYGSPLLNYYYPLPNYIATFMHFFWVSFIDAFKFEMFFASIVGALFLFFWLRKIWGAHGAVVGSVFYTFSPYHFVDVYVRGSVGETLTLALAPGVLFCVHSLVYEKKIKWLIAGSILLALLIFSHNILAYIFFLFIVFYSLFCVLQVREKKQSLIRLSLLLLFGLGISTIFWLPAILERQYVKGLQIYDIYNNFPEVYQLIFPSWGTGFSAGDLQNQMSFQIGVANLLAVAFSIYSLVMFREKIKHKTQVILFIAMFFIIFYLLQRTSYEVWKVVPLLNYFQFPWRLLSLEILICAFLAGSIFAYKKINGSKVVLHVVAGFMIIVAVGFSIGYTKPAYYHNRNDSYYFSRSNFMDGTNTPGNVFNTMWFNPTLKRTKDKLSSNDFIQVKNKLIKSTYYRFEVLNKKSGPITINTAYFPGWNVYINGVQQVVHSDKNGLISFLAKKGNQIIEVKFEDTPIRKIAMIISFVSIGLVATLMIRMSMI